MNEFCYCSQVSDWEQFFLSAVLQLENLTVSLQMKHYYASCKNAGMQEIYTYIYKNIYKKYSEFTFLK